LAVSGFRLRARLDFSIPSCSPGQRGITPAFGYSAPHPGPEGTSTPMIHALPSAHYSPSDEITVRWDDPSLNIDWQVPDPILSGRDASALLLKDIDHLPKYGPA
jgi:hypothetical protein